MWIDQLCYVEEGRATRMFSYWYGAGAVGKICSKAWCHRRGRLYSVGYSQGDFRGLWTTGLLLPIGLKQGTYLTGYRLSLKPVLAIVLWVKVNRSKMFLTLDSAALILLDVVWLQQLWLCSCLKPLSGCGKASECGFRNFCVHPSVTILETPLKVGCHFQWSYIRLKI